MKLTASTMKKVWSPYVEEGQGFHSVSSEEFRGEEVLLDDEFILTRKQD